MSDFWARSKDPMITLDREGPPRHAVFIPKTPVWNSRFCPKKRIRNLADFSSSAPGDEATESKKKQPLNGC